MLIIPFCKSQIVPNISAMNSAQQNLQNVDQKEVDFPNFWCSDSQYNITPANHDHTYSTHRKIFISYRKHHQLKNNKIILNNKMVLTKHHYILLLDSITPVKIRFKFSDKFPAATYSYSFRALMFDFGRVYPSRNSVHT